MKAKHQNIILIGYMGCGKSTLGRKIARKLLLPFVDVDQEIEQLLGLSISEIFKRHGELHFRELERTWLNHFSPKFNCVISIGGGLPCYKENMDILLDMGFVIYLERNSKELFQRLAHTKNQRPLLADLNGDQMLEFIEKKILEREVFYQKAHWTPTREQQNVKSITEKIHLLRSTE